MKFYFQRRHKQSQLCLAKTDIKMSDYNQNKDSFCLVRRRPHKYHIGNLDQIFKVLDEEDISAKQLIQCLATLSKKRESYMANIVKNRMLLWKKKNENYLKTKMI